MGRRFGRCVCSFFFTGIILGGYLFVFVPIWFVYAKIQRLSGIEAGQSEWTMLFADVEPDENGGDDDAGRTTKHNHRKKSSGDVCSGATNFDVETMLC